MLSGDVSVDNRSPPAAGGGAHPAHPPTAVLTQHTRQGDGGAHPAHPPAEVITQHTRQATAVLTRHTPQATAVLTQHLRRRR